MKPSRGRGQPPRSRVGRPPDSGSRRGGQGNHPVSNDHDRRMEHLASVSRSSGLGKDGELLKERVVQEEFRLFIDKKLGIFWGLYATGSLGCEPQNESVQKKDHQENILILFRKLREGLFASGRRDGFALEIYETSLFLSVVFDSPVQTTSILSRLVPELYPAIHAPQPLRVAVVLILLLHQLVIFFPSQQTYLDQVKCVVPNLFERPSSAYLWISAVARSLRTMNFVQLEKLTHPDAFEHLLPLSHPATPCTTTVFHELPRLAVRALVSRLRLKARDEAWIVVRNAYRELTSSEETRMWLGKRLLFDSFGCEATVVRFDEWVQERCQEGQLRPKEGVEGKWMVCKASSK